MSTDKKTIFLIVGQTASGKDSLVNAMCQIEKPPIQDMFGDIWFQGKYKQLISYTTRPRRKNEGDTHIFIQPNEVEQYKDQIIAYTKIGDYEYFATKDQLKECDFYIIDYMGIQTLRLHNLDDEFRFVTIYINTPDKIRKQRALQNRKDNTKVFNERNLKEEFQFDMMKKRADFDYSISNIDFDKAFKILKYIVQIELNKHKE